MSLNLITLKSKKLNIPDQKYYVNIKDKTFDFKQECLNYCKSDVDMLMNG